MSSLKHRGKKPHNLKEQLGYKRSNSRTPLNGMRAAGTLSRMEELPSTMVYILLSTLIYGWEQGLGPLADLFQPALGPQPTQASAIPTRWPQQNKQWYIPGQCLLQLKPSCQGDTGVRHPGTLQAQTTLASVALQGPPRRTSTPMPATAPASQPHIVYTGEYCTSTFLQLQEK